MVMPAPALPVVAPKLSVVLAAGAKIPLPVNVPDANVAVPFGSESVSVLLPLVNAPNVRLGVLEMVMVELALIVTALG